MIKTEPTIALPPPRQLALQRDIMNLENQSFAARLADYAGWPISRALRLVPPLAADATAILLERRVATLSAPVVSSLVTEIATRFGVVVTERSTASALPLLGAVGGATVNVIFMNRFQRVARGHFAIRRLERQYGRHVVRQLYNAHATQRQIRK
jgi:EcsC protein family